MPPLSAALSSESRPVTTERPRFMAFVSDAESERVLRLALPELTAQNDSVHRGDIVKANEYLAEHRSPELLIVDISGQARPLSKIPELSEVCEPGVQVIVIGDRTGAQPTVDGEDNGWAERLAEIVADLRSHLDELVSV